MKTKLFVSIVCVMLFSNYAYSQLKVNTLGKVIVGTACDPEDYNNEVHLGIYGTIGGYKTGSKLSFGDFGSTAIGAANVFVGEYGLTDSDQLWLQGKKGIYLTRGGSAGDIIGYYNETDGNKFTFNCDVYSSGTKLTSDERFKTNINNIDSALVKLKKLSGVNYNYNFPQGFGQNKSIADNVTSNQSSVGQDTPSANYSEKELREKEYYEQLKSKEEQQNKKKRLGFLAQDLQKVFPELVDQDSAGYFYVDYVGLIPVIIEALKEQQSIIDAQSLKIKELEDKIEDSSTKETKNSNLKSGSISTDTEILDETTNVFLFQNTPNPFKYDTEIKYYIPESSSNAVLYVFSLQGNLLLTKNLLGTGNGSVTIDGSELNPGMYVYSLLVNGQIVATKRMILTE